jgi:DnaD/phage-associated family protein
MTEYRFNAAQLTSSEAFAEASREELRVLLALVAQGGKIESEGTLAKASGVSKGRASSSLVFWEESGIITENDGTPTITEEFEARVELGKIDTGTAVATAKSVRDNELAGLISECATLMQRPALNTEEIKVINALYTQYALDEEYIITLAAYINEKGKLTAARLGTEAERLIKRGVDTAEKLFEYIEEKANESSDEWEFRHLLGIYNRTLTKSEQDYVKKWYGEFGFGEEIIGEAYDITVRNTGKLSLPYMDALLTPWHEGGCKSLEDCRAAVEKDKAARAVEEKQKAPPKMPRTPKNTPRYGNFDPLEAFEAALKRSYGDEKNDD